MVHEQRIAGANMDPEGGSNLANFGGILFEGLHENTRGKFKAVLFDFTEVADLADDGVEIVFVPGADLNGFRPDAEQHFVADFAGLSGSGPEATEFGLQHGLPGSCGS